MWGGSIKIVAKFLILKRFFCLDGIGCLNFSIADNNDYVQLIDFSELLLRNKSCKF